MGRYQIIKDKNPELFRQALALPREMINEYAYTGLYHLGEWEEKRLAPKAQLRAELEQKLQCSLPDDKPVVAFLQDEFCHPRQVTKALEALAPYVTLVIKGQGIPDIEGTYIWKDGGFAPNLLRFAADYILAGYHSGTLASSTMLGLRVIPYYTSLIYFNGPILGKLDKYTRYMPGHYKGGHVCVDIIQNINPPLDLLDTNAVLDRISDESWWISYAQGLPDAQKTIFGDYAISGAASKTARLLIRACGHGSFGEDVTTIGLRPEFCNF